MSYDSFTQDKPHVVAQFNTNDQAKVLHEIWRRTIGKGKVSVPPSRTYSVMDIRYEKPMSPGEANLQQQILQMSGVSIAASQINRHSRVINGPVGPFNYYTIHVKFEGGQDIGITIYKGLNPEPGKAPAEYKVSRVIRLDPYTIMDDPEWIMFMDIHPMCANSPLRWSKEELMSCGIEYLRIDNPEIMRQPKFEWKSSAVDRVDKKELDKKYDKAVVTRQVLGLPFEQKKALLMKVNGADALNGADPKNLARDIVVMLSDAIESDVEQVKRHMVGEFPKVVEALRLADIQQVIKFEDDRWFRVTGPADDSEYIEIPDAYLMKDRKIDRILFLANVLYGKEGTKSGIHFETLQDIVGITSARNSNTVPKPRKEDKYEKPVVEDDVDVSLFVSAFTNAIENGDIIIDLKKRRSFFNPDHTEEDDNLGIPGNFFIKGKTDEEQLKNAKDELIKRHSADQAKMRAIMKKLKRD